MLSLKRQRTVQKQFFRLARKVWSSARFQTGPGGRFGVAPTPGPITADERAIKPGPPTPVQD
jgi:hypothetical protein